MRVGLLLAAAVAVEIALLLAVASDAISVARIVLGVAIATQAAAIGTFVVERTRARGRTGALTPH